MSHTFDKINYEHDDGESALEEAHAHDSSDSPWIPRSKEQAEINIFKMFRDETTLTKTQRASIVGSRGDLYDRLQRFIADHHVARYAEDSLTSSRITLTEEQLDLAKW